MDNSLEEKLNTIQGNLKTNIYLKNKCQLDEINQVAGVDIANNIDYGVCCISIVDYSTKEIIEQVEYVGEVEFPYISGYLAFRELPLILKAVKKLRNSPDIYMFYGNGYLYRRHMEIATQASFDLGKPTIGMQRLI